MYSLPSEMAPTAATPNLLWPEACLLGEEVFRWRAQRQRGQYASPSEKQRPLLVARREFPIDRPVRGCRRGSRTVRNLCVDSKSGYYKKREVGVALALCSPSEMEGNKLTSDDSRLSDHTGFFPGWKVFRVIQTS